MATLRFKALEELFNRMPLEINLPSKIVSEYYGENVFNLPKMERYLSKEAYKVVKRAIDEGKSLTRERPIRLQQVLKHGLSGKVLHTTLTGFTRLPMELRKNMTDSLR